MSFCCGRGTFRPLTPSLLCPYHWGDCSIEEREEQERRKWMWTEGRQLTVWPVLPGCAALTQLARALRAHTEKL